MAAIAVTTENLLPKRLIDFFARYPPRLYGTHFTKQSIQTLEEKIAINGNKKTGAAPTIIKADPLVREIPATTAAPAAAIATQTATLTETAQSPPADVEVQPLKDPETSENLFDINPTSDPMEPNPFLPYRNPATGHWRGPRVSLRRQAELFKLARVYGVEPLLPPSVKSTSYKEQRLLERGLAVKGTGDGQKVKGHKWEREMGGVLKKRIEAMEKMPELIREWRMRGNGRGWKKYPR